MALSLNLEVLKTPSGLLKLVHTVLGAITVGIIGYYINYLATRETLFLMIVSFAFLLTSLLLLLTFLLDGEVVDSLSKSVFEILYHFLGFIFCFSAAVTMFVLIGQVSKGSRSGSAYASLLVSGVCPLLNSFAYFANVITAVKLRNG